jgi:hypothetical protein
MLHASTVARVRTYHKVMCYGATPASAQVLLC